MLDERSGQVRGGRKLADGQVFARKILRIFGDLTREDVDNEATVVSQVCREGQSNSIVEVYDHGWLPGFDSSYYYVDMEFCSQTLEDWIYSRSGFNDSGGVNATDGVIDSSLTTVMHTDDRYTCTAEEILVILQNITSGLQYLHQNRLVHRDLKPRNSTLHLQLS
jgi:serine/threonine protein kinase